MNIAALTSTTNMTTPNSSGTVDAMSKSMGKDAFLKLMVTQLRHQDPLSPMDNQDFLAQMAQFTSMEQMMNLVANTNKQTISSAMNQAVGLIGRTVTYTSGVGAEATEKTGSVDKVSMQDGQVFIHIGEEKVAVDTVKEVK